MIVLYFAIGLLMLLLLITVRSKGMMNSLLLLHACSYIGISVYALMLAGLPRFFSGKFFFMDNFALAEVALASAVFLLSILYLEGYVDSMVDSKELSQKNIKFFYVCLSLLLTSVTFAFFSNNLVVFWILLELTTILSAALIVILNAKENIFAALKYVFIASTAMLFSLIGLILLYAFTQYSLGKGTLNWDELMRSAGLISPEIMLASFILVFIGFAAKSGIVPFHTWLPHAHSKAPSAISALLSGVLLNIGIYGIIRMFAIAHQTQASSSISFFLLGMGILTMAVANLNMLQQKNTKELIAFSSIEHMGVILVGIGIATQSSVYWSLVYIAGHSIIKSMLFLCAGILNRQFHSNELRDARDVLALQPLASAGLILGSLAILGLPPFILFFPKFFILVELSRISIVLFLVVLMIVLLASVSFVVYMSKMFASVSVAHSEKERYDVPLRMRLSIWLLLAASVFALPLLGQGAGEILGKILVELGMR